jgi:hypothetical protein
MKQPTTTQGRYLAFIYYYTKLHRVPPAELDMQKYFRVSPPSVHQMVITLEANGFIERIPGQPRIFNVEPAFMPASYLRRIFSTAFANTWNSSCAAEDGANS